MEPDSLSSQGDAATVTPLDQVLWSVLTGESALAPFTRAWLALLCRMVPGSARAVLVLQTGGALAPVAHWPEGDPGNAQLNNIAEMALRERRGVISRPRPRGPLTPRTEDSRLSHLALPLLWDGEDQGVIAVECADLTDATARDAMRQLQWAVSWIELRRRRGQVTENSDRLHRGFTALEVAATALGTDRFDPAARAVATDIAVRLGANRVSIGWLVRRSMKLSGLSHAVGAGKRADMTVNLTAAMEEAADHATSTLWPTPEGDNPAGRAAHARLAARGGGPNVLTVPLTMHGRVTGALTIERDTPFDQAAIDLVEAIAALIGPILGLLHLQERWLTTIGWQIVTRTARQLVGPEHFTLKLFTAAAIAIVAFFALFHIEYHVNAQAVVEGEVRRTIASGLDGYIGGEFARAGQVVHAGDVLAKLDDTELNLQRLRWIATRQQHQAELDRALASGTRAEVNIDGAQVAEAEAEIAVLEAQLARTKIVAPFDGLITNGDLSQSVGMPVQRAQVLFEIAPLDSYRVIVRVPDNEIERVTPGGTGTLVLTALPDETFPLHVVRVTPIAEQADGGNTFHVEARLDGTSPRLRPNMEGVAKLDAGRHLLIWSWTHHLIDAIRLGLWSWWP